ncbi:hypothetical protein ABBQ38_015291 [Trebouxia sp. C0009 RCD-2024]
MDLAGIRQQVLSSNTSAQEKAEALLLERVVYELNSKEWRELLAGIPADVRRQIGLLKSADTVIDMSTEQEVTVQTEDGREYLAILFGGRLDVDAFKDQLAQDGLMLTKLDGKLPYRDGNGVSRTVFTAAIIKAQTARHPGCRTRWGSQIAAIIRLLQFRAAMQVVLIKGKQEIVNTLDKKGSRDTASEILTAA